MEDIFTVPRNCLHFANATIHCAAQVDDSSKTKQNAKDRYGKYVPQTEIKSLFAKTCEHFNVLCCS